MALEQFRAPALPLPPGAYEKRYFEQLNNALRLYFNQLDSETPNKAFSYRANFFEANTTTPFVPAKGRMGWNSFDQTLDLGMDYGVVQQIGMETYVRVQNSTGVLIPNGTVVGFAGVGPGGVVSVAPFLADGSQPTLYILGVVTHDLPDSGEVGYCTVLGHVRGFDTTGAPVGETWAVGDILYASPTVAGYYTNVKPTAPYNVVPVAAVLGVDADEGEVLVRPSIEQDKYYGVFSKTNSQAPAAINTAYALLFTTTQVSNGVSIGTPASRIVAVQSGLYQFDVTVQLTSGNSSDKSVWVWFRKNGTDIPNSARVATANINGGYVPVALSQTVSLGNGGYVEVMFAADNTNVSVSSLASTAFAPGAPAVLLSVAQVQL
jgi:hypothetical protein